MAEWSALCIAFLRPGDEAAWYATAAAPTVAMDERYRDARAVGLREEGGEAALGERVEGKVRGKETG